jgi:DNA-3-methyladenine glycosylase II
VTRTHDELSVMPPYRLDLTVSALRRLPTNAVDVLTPDGAYLRALAGAHGRVVVHVAQTGPARLEVVITGDERDHAGARAAARRMLGVDCDLTPFDQASARIPWLAPLARRMRGLKPPRYACLWEACVNAIVFQQVSLAAASAITQRLVVALGTPLPYARVPLYVFPSAEQVLGADDALLHATGLSASKRMTLRRVATAIAAGSMSEQLLAPCASPQAAARLSEIKGIGPWSAAVILLRGLGRLDVFPANDSSVRRNLVMAVPSQRVDLARTLDTLRPQQGMLYYHLLLARLEARGGLGAASVSALGRAPGYSQ